MIQFRKSLYEDIPEIVKVRVDTWRTTYSGIIDEEILKKQEINLSGLIENARKRFEEANGVSEETVVAIFNEKIIGFVNYGPYRIKGNKTDRATVEIYAIYVLEKFQNSGIGKKMFSYALKDLLKKQDYKKMIIWCLEKNPSISFYEKMGGFIEQKKAITIGNQILIELGFSFQNLENYI